MLAGGTSARRCLADDIPMWTEAVESGTFKGLPVVGMGYGDQKPGPFLKRLTLEIHGPIFSDNPLDISPWGDHTCTRMERRDNLGHSFIGS